MVQRGCAALRAEQKMRLSEELETINRRLLKTKQEHAILRTMV